MACDFTIPKTTAGRAGLPAVHKRLVLDVEELLHENSRLRAEATRTEARAWRAAAGYLSVHRTPQLLAAEMLQWYATSVLDEPVKVSEK
jgi:hypothetical protein